MKKYVMNKDTDSNNKTFTSNHTRYNIFLFVDILL